MMRPISFSLRVVILLVLAAVFFVGPHTAAAGDVTVEFYYGDGCLHCAAVEPFLDEMEQSYPDVLFERFETWHDQANGRQLLERFESYDVPDMQRGVPFVLVGGQFLVGDTPIENGLEKLIQQTLADTFETDTARVAEPAADTFETDDTLPDALTFSAIVGAAFVDSINPCAIAVLVILLSSLLMIGDPRRALRSGLAFITSVYIAYMLFGLGLAAAIQASGISSLLFRVIGIIAILIGLANLKDAIWYGGGGFVMEIPRRWRPRLQGVLKSITSPVGAFLIGFIVTLFELPCTGGPYLFVIGLLADGSSMSSIVPVLLFYNVIFVLPLIILTLLLTRGRISTERVGAWKDSHLRLLHLIGGLIMLALGLWVLIQ